MSKNAWGAGCDQREEVGGRLLPPTNNDNQDNDDHDKQMMIMKMTIKMIMTNKFRNNDDYEGKEATSMCICLMANSPALQSHSHSLF